MRNDLRVVKTENAIRGAFVSLLGERPFEKITVTDILKRALINRKTFYAHYDDKFDLADKMTEELYDEFAAFLERQEHEQPTPAYDMLSFVEEQRERVFALWKLPASEGTVHDRVQATLAGMYVERARSAGVGGNLEFQGNLYAAVRLEVLQYVMDSGNGIDADWLLAEAGSMYRFLKEQMQVDKVLDRDS